MTAAPTLISSPNSDSPTMPLTLNPFPLIGSNMTIFGTAGISIKPFLVLDVNLRSIKKSKSESNKPSTVTVSSFYNHPSALGVFKTPKALGRFAEMISNHDGNQNQTFDVLISIRGNCDPTTLGHASHGHIDLIEPETIGQLRSKLRPGTKVIIQLDLDKLSVGGYNGINNQNMLILQHWLECIEEACELGGLMLPNSDSTNKGNWISSIEGILTMDCKTPMYGSSETMKAQRTLANCENNINTPSNSSTVASTSSNKSEGAMSEENSSVKSGNNYNVNNSKSDSDYKSKRLTILEACNSQSTLQTQTEYLRMELMKKQKLLKNTMSKNTSASSSSSSKQKKSDSFVASGDKQQIEKEKRVEEREIAKKKKEAGESMTTCSINDGKDKKACANCSCGRSELEAEYGVERAKEMVRNGEVSVFDITIGNGEVSLAIREVESKCGNCYLGDDYRCEGCPFRGMPAFEKGEKPGDTSVKLKLGVDK